MTRHARNCTAGAVYTYHEKKKDAQASGYGTNSQRLGKDSLKDFDCCSLSLQPCRNPVITKDGHLFDKEVILQYIITKKNEYSRKMKEYERLKKKEEEEILSVAEARRSSTLNRFLEGEKSIVSPKVKDVVRDEAAGSSTSASPSSSMSSSRSTSSSASTSSISNMENGHEKKLPSFWVPSMTPAAEKPKLEKPSSTIVCPISGKSLKVKDLVDVHFTPIRDDPKNKKCLIARENRYMCAITHDALGNSVPCAVLKPTGDVVTLECVEKVIKKDWTHPISGKKLKEDDIIIMQRGGTGYALTNTSLEAKHERPALQV